MARRRKTGQRTARENVDDLLDPGSLVEYGPLVVAARRRRHSLDELIKTTPADGMLMGLGSVNGDVFPEDRARTAVLAYDYTVLAGTQGANNHSEASTGQPSWPTAGGCRDGDLRRGWRRPAR